jgi:hypothetical protein
MSDPMDRYGTLGQFLGAQVCRLWRWVRGLGPDDGPQRSYSSRDQCTSGRWAPVLPPMCL